MNSINKESVINGIPQKTNENGNRELYIKVQNVIRDAKIKKYIKESDYISSEGISFLGGITGKNTLQLERIRNVKLRIELLQSKRIPEKDSYERLDMLADLYACAISELSGNFTKEMQNIYDSIKETCVENGISDENIYNLACEKILCSQAFLPIIHQEKTKGVFYEIRNQISFYKIENQRLETQIILERGKSQFGTFEYYGKDVGVIIPTNIKNNKKSLTNI